MSQHIDSGCSVAPSQRLSPAQHVLLALIRLYQITLSPFLGRQCRFYPTCSHYADEAVRSHGATRGALLTMTRLSKCHPFHRGGVDLVPESDQPRHLPPNPVPTVRNR